MDDFRNKGAMEMSLKAFIISILFVIIPFYTYAEVIELGPDTDKGIPKDVKNFLLDPTNPFQPCPIIDVLQPVYVKAACKYTFDTDTGIFEIPPKCYAYIRSGLFEKGHIFSSSVCVIKVNPVDTLDERA